MQSRKSLAAFILSLIMAMIIIAMFYSPQIRGTENNGPVVTSEIKSLETALRQLKANSEARKVQAVNGNLATIKEKWQRLKPGLTARNIENSAQAIAFEQALSDFEAVLKRDKESISRALPALNSSFSQVKSALQTTPVIDKGRFLLMLSSFLVFWVGMIITTTTLVRKLSLKQ